MERGPDGNLQKIQAEILLEMYQIENRARAADNPLLSMLDTHYEECHDFSDILDVYDLQLDLMGQDMHDVEEFNANLHLRITNRKKLLSVIEQLIRSLDIEPKYLFLLNEAKDLGTHRDFDFQAVDLGAIRKLEDAALRLSQVMAASNENVQALGPLFAVNERLTLFKTVVANFGNKLLKTLCLIIDKDTSFMLADKARYSKKGSGCLTLQTHAPLHATLRIYEKLFQIFSELDDNLMEDVVAIYEKKCEEVYEKEIKAFSLLLFDGPHLILKRKGEEDFYFSTPVNTAAAIQSLVSLKDITAENILIEKITLDVAVEFCLHELLPLVNTEYEFCLEFFDDLLESERSLILSTIFKSFLTCLDYVITKKCQAGASLISLQLMQVLQRNSFELLRAKFIESFFIKWYQFLESQFKSFIDHQIDAIIEQRRTWFKKRPGNVLPMVVKFPGFVRLLDQIASTAQSRAIIEETDNQDSGVNSKVNHDIPGSPLAITELVRSSVKRIFAEILETLNYIKTFSETLEFGALNNESLESHRISSSNDTTSNSQSVLCLDSSRLETPRSPLFDASSVKSNAESTNSSHVTSSSSLKKLSTKFRTKPHSSKRSAASNLPQSSVPARKPSLNKGVSIIEEDVIVILLENYRRLSVKLACDFTAYFSTEMLQELKDSYLLYQSRLVDNILKSSFPPVFELLRIQEELSEACDSASSDVSAATLKNHRISVIKVTQSRSLHKEEISKTLFQAMKKLNKILSSEDGLLLVVWATLEKELLNLFSSAVFPSLIALSERFETKLALTFTLPELKSCINSIPISI